MGDFAALIHNENIKIYRRLRTWIMLCILVLMSALFPMLVHFSSRDSEFSIGLWDSFQSTVAIAMFLNAIFTVLIAADSVAGEFSWGTIKLLLIRPWSRTKILLSKYISVILFSLFSTALLIAFGYGSALIFSPSAAEPITNSQTLWGQGEYVFLLIMCSYIELFLTAAIAFMISSVFRSSGLAITLSLSIMFTKDIFMAIFNPERYEWAKYLIFAHMDLSGYLLTDRIAGGATLGFSIAVLAVYYVVIMLVSWLVFRKRDVAA